MTDQEIAKRVNKTIGDDVLEAVKKAQEEQKKLQAKGGK